MPNVSKSIGAIIGDIVGSPYEFANIKSKDFPLFSDNSHYTDDSILTIATMKALMDGATLENFKFNYQVFGNKYPNSYGGNFYSWLVSEDPKPYNSWGNGSAMRVSPVAWFYDNLEDVERVAKLSAEVTHNHTEGIKGAQATAAAIYLARTGKNKQEIKKYIESKYVYRLDFRLDEIRPSYAFDESCQGTVPPAIVAFLESTDFEDSLRNAVSLGGDSDTLVAITGSIAEAFYNEGVERFGEIVESYLPVELLSVAEGFTKAVNNFKD